MPETPQFTPWTLKSIPDSFVPEHDVADLARRLEVSALLVRLMALRGLESDTDMDRFLSPGLRYLHPLEDWPGVLDGARCICDAIARGEALAVWGDYDVDGITATALVKDMLANRGVQIHHYIPDRLDFGYGLHMDGIQALADQGVRLLLTVDCGIANIAEIREARRLGMRVIVTDHHLPGRETPDADVIINPKYISDQGNADSQTTHWPSQELAGVGVSFLLMAAVNRMLPGPAVDIRDYLDLVALGTIADAVQLDEQNRILVKNGLLLIKEGRRPGILALKEVCSIGAHETVGAGAIGFALAPRINAAGRIGDPDLAVRLLLEKNMDEARKLAIQLDKLNTKRKQEEHRILEEAIAQAEEQLHLPGLVLHSEHWHSGIIGIVASRIVERFHRPCLILTKENGIFKGSGRSTPSFDLYTALLACKQCLYKFGGHRQAAGLKLEPFQLATLKKLFAWAVEEQLGENPAPPVLELDMELPFAAVTATLLKELELLQPYGQGNPRPIFLSPVLDVHKVRFFSQKKHLEMYLADSTDGTVLRAVAWRQGERWSKLIHDGATVRIAYTPRLAKFNNLLQIELAVHDIVAFHAPRQK
ncbi:single-stranded-DNA-specific exonuclease RecJ [Desulfovibrionales bacterium]